MGYVPENVKWFIAEMVEEITVVGDPRNVVHVNYTLIRADSAEDAYTKALELGRKVETNYENPEGKRVSIRFRGLRNLLVVYDELEHGAELMFEQTVAVPPVDLDAMVKRKEQLEVFVPWRAPDSNKQPDYASRDIIDEVKHRFGIKRFSRLS